MGQMQKFVSLAKKFLETIWIGIQNTFLISNESSLRRHTLIAQGILSWEIECWLPKRFPAEVRHGYSLNLSFLLLFHQRLLSFLSPSVPDAQPWPRVWGTPLLLTRNMTRAEGHYQPWEGKETKVVRTSKNPVFQVLIPFFLVEKHFFLSLRQIFQRCKSSTWTNIYLKQ